MKANSCIALVCPGGDYYLSSFAVRCLDVLLSMGWYIIYISPSLEGIDRALSEKARARLEKLHAIEFPLKDETHGRLDAIRQWNRLAKLLKKKRRELELEIELVFFAPLDSMLSPGIRLSVLDWAFPYKWSGIFNDLSWLKSKKVKLDTDPSAGDPDYLFSSKNCVGVGIVDRFCPEQLKSRIYKKVVVFPQSGNLSLEGNPSKYAGKIRKMAGQRTVLGLLGTSRHESLADFLHLVLADEKELNFYIFAGDLDINQLSHGEVQLFNRITTRERANLLFITKNPEDGAGLNSLFKQIDVLYFHTQDYQRAPWFLTKAAWFERPVVCGDRDTVAEYVHRFNLGICVHGKPEETLRAIEKVRSKMINTPLAMKASFENYAELQDDQHLREAWEQLLLF